MAAPNSFAAGRRAWRSGRTLVSGCAHHCLWSSAAAFESTDSPTTPVFLAVTVDIDAGMRRRFCVCGGCHLFRCLLGLDLERLSVMFFPEALADSLGAFPARFMPAVPSGPVETLHWEGTCVPDCCRLLFKEKASEFPTLICLFLAKLTGATRLAPVEIDRSARDSLAMMQTRELGYEFGRSLLGSPDQATF